MLSKPVIETTLDEEMTERLGPGPCQSNPQYSYSNIIRHRPNQHANRQLNRALDIIAKIRMRLDPTSKAYVQRRTEEGKTIREIRLSLP